MPLAERLRPRSLEEFVGQQALLGPKSPLGPVVAGRAPLPSLILWGPPGSGKTTLARLLAECAGLQFRCLSAVQAGVREVRAEIDQAARLARSGLRTALFVDEIHRFNKAQQDALLPYVERGSVVLIGATTENPSFEVIPALRSRCPVFILEPHATEGLVELLERALSDPERGLGSSREADPEALEHIARAACGDARRALNLLEAAAGHTSERIDRAAVEQSLDSQAPSYDKAGDAHYDVISAFIKSLRGSDPDAALYWLARMLAGGEDPRFICRRMIIFASEDIGNAEPHALPLAVATAEAFDRIGMPEGRIPLAHCVTYLASAPKSKASYLALGAALDAAKRFGALPVPMHLRNAPTELMRRQGYGAGYQNPHAAPEHFVRTQYAPDALAGERFYFPTQQGAEASLCDRLDRLWRREPPSGDGEDS